MILPQERKKLATWSQDIIARCRASVALRSAEARSIKTWVYTGSPDGQTAILNRLFPHLDRKSSYIFSPNDLRFHIDFTHNYDKSVLDKAEVAARVLTRTFEQRDIDLQFGQGVFLALMYGSCFPKLINTHGGMKCSLVMPWQLGVYREDLNDLGSQEAISERSYITPMDLWRRISHLPDRVEMFKRAMAYARSKTDVDEPQGGYFHQILIAGMQPSVQTDPPFTTQPGGLAQVQSAANAAMISPDVAQEMIALDELWVVDDERQDYTTIQMVEPDILIAPRIKRTNMFVPDYLPYGMIQPNQVHGYIWGRSEIADLMKLQHLLRDRMEDIKKLMGLQYDRLWAFMGGSGMVDEQFDAMKESGFFSLEAGAKVEDVTPELPKEWAADIQEIMKFFDEVAGFNNILSGSGEPGVRAGNHAQTLLKTASPRLRDDALTVERQCADLADKAFQVLCAKEAKAYWTAPTKENPEGEEFLLDQLPEDYRIQVDSHSSSPIYEEDHQQMASFLAKLQIIDGESLLDLIPIPMRDILKVRYRAAQEAKAKMIQEHPELLQEHKGGKKKAVA
jgi:hypothetical protein